MGHIPRKSGLDTRNCCWETGTNRLLRQPLLRPRHLPRERPGAGPGRPFQLNVAIPHQHITQVSPSLPPSSLQYSETTPISVQEPGLHETRLLPGVHLWHCDSSGDREASSARVPGPPGSLCTYTGIPLSSHTTAVSGDPRLRRVLRPGCRKATSSEAVRSHGPRGAHSAQQVLRTKCSPRPRTEPRRPEHSSCGDTSRPEPSTTRHCASFATTGTPR